MKPEELLKNYILKSRPYLDKFFKDEIDLATPISPIATQMVKRYWQFMGGKNLRGALTYYSYLMFGGSDEESILKASTIVEITHAFALMHDDVMDQDSLRRGQLTIHRQYEKMFRQEFARGSKKRPEHFGLSLAIDLGDLGSYFSNLILARTNFPDAIKIKFLQTLSRTIVNTAFGQALDVFYEAESKLSLAKILRVHLYKTANYTITGPLKYGAVLAGISDASPRFHAIESFGAPVGLAFQLRDDELGMFSTEKELGKPADSDLREGKNTLLFQKVFEKGTPQQVKLLKHVHGNPRPKPEDVEKVRKIIVGCGALSYSQNMARRLVEKGKKFIPLITKDEKYRQLLTIAADYVIERNN